MSSEMFAPYQIDFDIKNTSKTFGFSKKKITWKFGIANKESLAQGLTGPNCRGSEHEIILTWSLNSGKRQILADGKDVHYSETGQNGWTSDQVFQHQFPIRVPGLSAPLRCHLITQPANRDMPQIKPFDVRVNGISYFSMSKIFQLGTPQMVSRPLERGGSRNSSGLGGGGGGQPHSQDNDPYMSPDERKAIAAAKVASMRDLQHQRVQQSQQSLQGPVPAPPPRVEENLMSFLDDPIPPLQSGPGQAQYASSMTMDASMFGHPAPPHPQPVQQTYSNYSMASMSSLNGPPPPMPHQTSFSSLPYASQGSMGSPQPQPPQQSRQSFGQPPPPVYPPHQHQQQPPQQQPYYQQQQPPQALTHAPFGTPQQALPSPSNQTMASYQSYGSAPSFAQPPQQQQYPQHTPQPPQQQQYQQQPPPPPQQYYGAPQAHPQY